MRNVKNYFGLVEEEGRLELELHLDVDGLHQVLGAQPGNSNRIGNVKLDADGISEGVSYRLRTMNPYLGCAARSKTKRGPSVSLFSQPEL